ncbi:Aspartate aminotransferase, mitochondrial [Glycine soja]
MSEIESVEKVKLSNPIRSTKQKAALLYSSQQIAVYFIGFVMFIFRVKSSDSCILSAMEKKGAYRDDDGKPVVLECVREAERRIAGIYPLTVFAFWVCMDCTKRSFGNRILLVLDASFDNYPLYSLP